jgi:hypothetical protein
VIAAPKRGPLASISGKFRLEPSDGVDPVPGVRSTGLSKVISKKPFG